jgi:DNA mismatch repair protein MutL
MAVIRLLSDQTINQIAAGEVVENAASVVKELIENSIDAGASRISIEIRGGGRQQIRVSDDGVGMERADALLAFERHATSKIAVAEDLEGVATHGFRGEALPSIAAVSKVQLTTSVGETEGWRVSIEGGRILECQPTGRGRGTTIDVRSLFFNVPARAKFQRSVRSDQLEVHRVVTLAALSHPEIAFRLLVQGEIAVDLPLLAGSRLEMLRQRICQLLGEEWASACLVEGEGVLGIVGSPQNYRSTRSGHYLFVNQRPIYSALVSRAVTDGFGPRLPPQRYPLCCLHLDLEKGDLDVNVHPQKREVRFRNEEQLVARVERAVDAGLTRHEVANRPKINPSAVPIQSIELPISRLETPLLPPSTQEMEQLILYRPVEPFATWRHYILVDVEQLPDEWCKKLSAPERGVAWVDGRSAQARIEFERMVAGKLSQTHPLLVPHLVELSSEEIPIIEGIVGDLSQLGLEVRHFGGRTFAIESLPFKVEGDLSLWFRELIDQTWRQEDKKAIEREGRYRLAKLICRRAAASLDHLSLGEGRALLAGLQKCTVPWESPQGRPIFAFYSIEGIEDQFSRGSHGRL